MNIHPFEDIEAICRRPVPFIAGESAPTPESSAKRPTGSRSVHGTGDRFRAGHVDLYDCVDLIPFDELTAFFRKSLT